MEGIEDLLRALEARPVSLSELMRLVAEYRHCLPLSSIEDADQIQPTLGPHVPARE
jgi:hypothetical protein